MVTTTAEMMQYAMQFLGIISPFIILVLSTVYADDLIRLLKKAVSFTINRGDSY